MAKHAKCADFNITTLGPNLNFDLSTKSGKQVLELSAELEIQIQPSTKFEFWFQHKKPPLSIGRECSSLALSLKFKLSAAPNLNFDFSTKSSEQVLELGAEFEVRTQRSTKFQF